MAGHDAPSPEPVSRETAAAIWTELHSVVKQLKARKVPDSFVMGNRGRLTRSQVDDLLR